jgi:hypothetical protein
MAGGERVGEENGEDGWNGGEVGKVEIDLKGKDFHHPFMPYKIQEEFMETVYRVLESGGGRVGILESPTGTVGVLFIFLISGPYVALACYLVMMGRVSSYFGISLHTGA